MGKAKLVGYARKSKRGDALKLDISLEDFLLAKRYSTKDGKQYVNLVLNRRALSEVLDGKREVTSVAQMEG